MLKRIVLGLCMGFLAAAGAMAQDPGAEPKELSGMSIVGNDDAPKSLYIVPWKSSEIGVETSLSRTLSEGDRPVDRDVFRRELAFYEVSSSQKSTAHTARHDNEEPKIAVSKNAAADPYHSIAPKF